MCSLPGQPGHEDHVDPLVLITFKFKHLEILLSNALSTGILWRLMPELTVTVLNAAATRSFLIGVRAVVEDRLETELRNRRNQDGLGPITSIQRKSIQPPYLYGNWELWDAEWTKYFRIADQLDITSPSVVIHPDGRIWPNPPASYAPRQLGTQLQEKLTRHGARDRRGHFVTFGFHWFVEDLGDAPAPFPDPDSDVTFSPLFVYWEISNGALVFKVDQMAEGDLLVDVPWPSSWFIGSVLTLQQHSPRYRFNLKRPSNLLRRPSLATPRSNYNV
jgi:hypothetical protein